MVTPENVVELLEALEIEEFVEEEDVLNMIQEVVGESDKMEVSYKILKEKLYEFIVKVKNQPFSSLVKVHYSVPVDRVSKFLDMLQDDLNFG